MDSGGTASAEARVLWHLDPSAPSADDLLAMAGSLDRSAAAVWAALPEVAMRLVAPQETLPGRSSSTLGRMRNLGRALVSSRGPRLARVGPAVFLSTSVQTDRVLKPVVDALASTLGPAERYQLPSLGPTSALAAQRAARSAHQELRRWLRISGLAEPPGIEEELAKAEVLHRRALAAVFEEDGVGVLVAASQHNSPTRALIAAATGISAGPATCYIPHAPVADNPFYRDLPFHHALLRGPSEVDFYRHCGVEDHERVRVVGQPGFVAPPADPVRDASHVVYAATPYADEVLRADIDVIRGGVDRPVEVCLHPRMSLEGGLRTFPQEWTVHPPGPTLEVLRARGTFALIQHGSGVGLEALNAGIEVINLGPAGERPNYPYLSPPYVQLASDTAGLRRALEAVPGRRGSRKDRTRFARSWCSAFEPAASETAAGAIRSIAETPRPRDVLLDGWASPPRRS